MKKNYKILLLLFLAVIILLISVIVFIKYIIEPYPRAGPAPNPNANCDKAIQQVCSTSLSSLPICNECLSAHQHVLRQAYCTPLEIEKWCKKNVEITDYLLYLTTLKKIAHSQNPNIKPIPVVNEDQQAFTAMYHDSPRWELLLYLFHHCF